MSTRHTWPHMVEAGYCCLDGSQYADGNARTERTCIACGLVKVTVHPPHGLPWREWRTAAGKVWRGDATPPCLSQRAEPAEVGAVA